MVTSPNLLPFRRTYPFAEKESAQVRTPHVLLGPSASIARVWSQIRRVAPYFRTALITGEPGTGAETVAHTLHSLSPLAARPFTVIRAAEAEAKFAGAAPMKFHGHTLFFEDIERLSIAAQHGLLRLMQNRRSSQTCVIASAMGELKPLVAAGSFSGVLASSLSALQITLPPLRERREDIPAMALHFLTQEAKGSHPSAEAGFFEALSRAEWRGNIDQMQAVLRRLLERFSEQALSAVMLPELMQETGPKPMQATEPVRLLKLEQVVQEHIRAVLLRCNGNKLRAAEVLGISRSTLYRMLDAQSVIGREFPLAG
jgi:two-component system response regulator HydG